MLSPLDSIPHLSSARWEKARRIAKNRVVDGLIEPKYTDYDERPPSLLGPKARWVIGFLLALVAVAAFWISAGKQISASTMLFKPLVVGQEHLSDTWSDGAVIAGLALGEAGTISFSLFSAVLAGQAITLRGLTFKPRGVMFRILSVACAFLAVLANITITAIHDETGFTVFAWFVTLAPPMIVIGIGLVIESMVLQGHLERAEAEAKFAKAHQEYEFYTLNPDKHGTFNERWYICIYEEICYPQPIKPRIDALVRDYGGEIKGQLVMREIKAHDFWAQLEATIANPTLPPIVEGSNLLPLSLEPQTSSS